MAATVGSAKASKDTAVTTYDFRCNAEVGEEAIKAMLKDVAKHWIFQREVSDTGYDHYQGRMALIKRRRVGELKSKWKEITEAPMPNFLAPTTNPEFLTGSFAYVMKNDTRVEGPWSDVDVITYIPRQYRGMLEQLYPWQRQVYDSGLMFDNRTINLVYCPEGCTGKSTMAAVCRFYGMCWYPQ